MMAAAVSLGVAPRPAVAAGHLPVMRDEVVAALAPRDGGLYVDCTFGEGGYTRAILAAADCRVIAVDRDPRAVALARARAAECDGRLTVLEGRFGDLEALLTGEGVAAVDGIAFDLGVSSAHLDEAERGFSFRFDGPLDMRMGGDGETAADLLARLPEQELARLIFEYGEERRSRRVASAIVEARAVEPILRTGQLAALVRRVVPASRDGIDPATRTFQALRMAVNDEPGELRRGLEASERLLAPSGRLAIVAFHSIEDRLVKEFLRHRTGMLPAPSRHLPAAILGAGQPEPGFRLVERRPLTPSAAEIAANPRSRSARLRVAERLGAAPLSLC